MMYFTQFCGIKQDNVTQSLTQHLGHLSKLIMNRYVP